MTVRSRSGARVVQLVATLATALPVSLGSSRSVVLATPSGARHAHRPGCARGAAWSARTVRGSPVRVAPRTTIAGSLSSTTKQERHRKIKVSSAKGSHTWTASALAEHDLPSAAMRAYKHAARTHQPRPARLPPAVDPARRHRPRGVRPRPLRRLGARQRRGPATGDRGHRAQRRRVRSPRSTTPTTAASTATRSGTAPSGRCSSSRRPGAPPVATATATASHPPTTSTTRRWPSAATCATAAATCPRRRGRAAIFSYNHSDYYVALVIAFAQGYETGTFVIPSPPRRAGCWGRRRSRAQTTTREARPRRTAAQAHGAQARPRRRRASKGQGAAARAGERDGDAHQAKPSPSPPQAEAEAEAHADPDADAYPDAAS